MTDSDQRARLAQKYARDAWHACYQAHDYDTARRLFEQAANEFRALGDSWNLIKVLRGLAHAQGNLGDADGALRTLAAVVRHARRMRSDQFPSPRDRDLFLCKTFHNIALAYSKRGDWRRSLHNVALALRYLKQTGNNDPHQRGLLHLTNGIALIRLKRYPAALKQLRKALPLFRDENNPYHQAVCGEYIGEIFLEQGDTKKALAQLDRAVELMHAARNTRPTTWCLRGIARERLGMLQEAGKDFTAATALMEDRRNAITAGPYRATYVSAHVNVYNAAVRNAVALKEFERAYDYVQRAKSRRFNEALEYPLPPLAQADEQAYQRLLAARRDLDAALNGQNGDTGADAGSVRRMERQYESILRHVRLRHESLDQALAERIASPSLGVADVRALLSDGDALVEYYYDNSLLHFFVITPKTFAHAAVPNAHGEIGRLLRGVRETMASVETCRADRRAEVHGRYRWYMDHAARKLLAPVEDHLQGIRRLFIVPHRKLHYFPFAALPKRDGGDLLDTCEIHYAVSPRMIAVCRERTSPSPGMFIIVVNPLHDLAHAEAEGRALAAIHPEGTHLFIGRGAYRSKLESYLSLCSMRMCTVKCIHFACHAVIDPRRPMHSALILNDKDDEESRLRVQEILSHWFPLDLVSLNCCESALGDAAPDDEATCFTRAFLRIGAKNVLATLWKIDDESSSKIIVDFYRGIITDGLGKAESLRRAQLKAKREGLSPYHWAPFQIIGE